MSSRYSIDRDLKEIAKMGETLQHYVLSDMLYMSIEGGLFGSRDMPQITMGAFLLRLRRLNQFRDEMNGVQQATLDKAIAQHNAVRNEWTVHYEQKMEREAESRLKLLAEFFRDCRDNVKECSDAYRVEALKRTIVQELVMALDEQGYESQAVKSRVYHTDKELRGWVTDGEFIWSDKLMSVYPKERFWWLYGRVEPTEVSK